MNGRILIVDDESRFRKSLMQLLRRFEYDVRDAADGMAAVQILEQGKTDVVLLDVDMPGLSGKEIFSIIREQGLSVETICLTGAPVIEDALYMMRKGVFDYLAKPVSIEDLLRVLGRAVKNRRIRNWDTDDAGMLSRYVRGPGNRILNC
ncbi:response regulator [Maridesulfovibrio sp.]|uniref:response regulator n=1 Tax=Maridesulfovibrio sp. TaxID=2795000 RepID=UPI002A189DB3|nr:response regulator [Maridesulfovibrio sp.]